MAWWLNYCVIDFSWKYRLSGMLGASMFDQNVHKNLWLWWENLLQWMPSEMWTMWRKIWSRCYKSQRGAVLQRKYIVPLFWQSLWRLFFLKLLFFYTATGQIVCAGAGKSCRYATCCPPFQCQGDGPFKTCGWDSFSPNCSWSSYNFDQVSTKWSAEYFTFYGI